MTSHSLPRVAYVAGYGRSGSTYLDIVLGSMPGVCSLGEVGVLWKLLSVTNEIEGCACGSDLRTCPCWSARVRDVSPARAAGIVRAAKRMEGWTALLRSGRATGATADEYRQAHRALFEGAACDGIRWCVDSSKTAYRFFWRPRALRAVAGLDVSVIHLVRDPRAVVASCLHGQNSRLAVGDESVRPGAGLIALAGWWFANVGALVNAAFVGRERRMVVVYEELASDPGPVVAALARFLETDASTLARSIELGEPMEVGHLVAGNRMAKAGSIRHRGIELRARLPWYYEVACLPAAGLYAWLVRRRPG